MTVADFMYECLSFPYSKENYDLIVECSQIALMEQYIENQEFIKENAEVINSNKNIFTEAYFQEADDAKKDDIKNKKNGAIAHAFLQIWKIICNLWKRFTSIFKKFATTAENFFAKLSYVDPEDIVKFINESITDPSKSEIANHIVSRLIANYLIIESDEYNGDLKVGDSLIKDFKLDDVFPNNTFAQEVINKYKLDRPEFPWSILLLYALKANFISSIKYYFNADINKSNVEVSYYKMGFLPFRNKDKDTHVIILRYVNSLSLVSDELALACNDNKLNVLSKYFIKSLNRTNETIKKFIGILTDVDSQSSEISIVPTNIKALDELCNDLENIKNNFNKCQELFYAHQDDADFFTDVPSDTIVEFQKNVAMMNNRIANYLYFVKASIFILKRAVVMSNDIKYFLENK